MEAMSDLDLLATMIGRKAGTLLYEHAGGSIEKLLNDSAVGVYQTSRAAFKLQAARELVRRSLCEKLRNCDVLSSPTIVRQYLQVQLNGREHEVFFAIFLSAQNRVIACEEMFRGTLTQTSVYPREVVKHALFRNAAAIIFAHNHPSGVAEPSHSDEVLTQSLRQALALVDVKVLDHFIVGGGAVMSFAERGLL
jgi:DNA repair protein RadC